MEESELLRQITRREMLLFLPPKCEPRCVTELLHAEDEVLEQFLEASRLLSRPSELQDLSDGAYGLCARLLASMQRLRADLPTLSALLEALAACPRLLRPLWRLLEAAPQAPVACKELLELLAHVADLERQKGCYEVTTKGLLLIEGLFQVLLGSRCCSALRPAPWSS